MLIKHPHFIIIKPYWQQTNTLSQKAIIMANFNSSQGPWSL